MASAWRTFANSRPVDGVTYWVRTWSVYGDPIAATWVEANSEFETVLTPVLVIPWWIAARWRRV